MKIGISAYATDSGKSGISQYTASIVGRLPEIAPEHEPGPLDVQLGGRRHRVAGTGRDHRAALDGLIVDGGTRKVQADLGPVLALFGLDQDAVAHDDETFLRF